MKKILFSLAVIAANFVTAQISLEHSFPDNETMIAYTKSNEIIYVSSTPDNKLKIYNSDFSLRKTIDVPFPANYKFYFYQDALAPYSISKHIFNTDEKYEFLVEGYFADSAANVSHYKLILINEDGQLIKDFHPDPTVKSYYKTYTVFHDSFTNKNMLMVGNSRDNYMMSQYDVYSLPTTALGNKEIQLNNKLSAFPVPADKILNIINPKNGSNKVDIYDATGKVTVSKSFDQNEDKIIVNVENLSKGMYIYTIGEQSSKFIKR